MRPGLSEGIAQLRSASAPRRSCIRVVVVTAQPLPTSETRNCGSTLASVKNTWLNEAYPFIWRNGCTVTPGCLISRMKYDRPRCFGWSQSVRASNSPQCALCALVVHLLPVDDPLIAPELGSRHRTGHVGAAAWFAEQLAPDILAGQNAQQ